MSRIASLLVVCTVLIMAGCEREPAKPPAPPAPTPAPATAAQPAKAVAPDAATAKQLAVEFVKAQKLDYGEVDAVIEGAARGIWVLIFKGRDDVKPLSGANIPTVKVFKQSGKVESGAAK